MADGSAAAGGPALDRLVLHRARFRVERRGLSEADLVAEVELAVEQLAADPRLAPGAHVAIAVGSRGIDRLPLVVRAMVWRLRGLGCLPYVFAAMGSHGGGDAAGQREVLGALGVVEDAVGCEIRTGTAVQRVGRTEHGLRVVFDRAALTADAVLAVNRVKPHTHMRPPGGSGLRKLLTVGAGHADQAARIHRVGAAGLADAIDDCVRVVLDRVPVVGGVALLEDAVHQVAQVHAVPAHRLLEEEPHLLRRAASWAPRLPLDRVDLLIIDRIGKDISGSGMDTTVVGRVRAVGLERWDAPDVAVVYARSLTEATQGNALGMGLADVVHRRLADAVDPAVTTLNALTCASPGMAARPLVAGSDREALEWILEQLLPAEVDPVVVWLPDTLRLDDLVLSRAALHRLPETRVPEAEGPATHLRFDDGGDLVPVPALR